MSVTAADLRHPATAKRRRIGSLLEDERWLALVLLLPTMLLLGLFIAYPFVKGVLLALTDAKVGEPGHWV
ncbi:MAG: sugar ABC transporter permease, partial [Acetobacteraceae bacterium]|nr:sugar ABC transporter permease [Acetobacteraceae bacterium]